MNLGQIRAKFCVASGRADLTALGSMADFFINSGIAFLDGKLPSPRSVNRDQQVIAAGTYKVKVKGYRSILEVWTSKSSDPETVLLARMTQTELRTLYPDFSLETQGSPEYWAPIVSTRNPFNESISISDTDIDDLYVSTAPGYDEQYILIMPPPDEQTTVTVFGTNKQVELDADAETNWWTVNYPEVVILAACYELEVFYRNFEGANSWLAAIERKLVGIDADSVRQESNDIVQLEG